MLPNTMNPMGLNRKPANDCLPDGTFDTTPRAIIRGGACLINGDDMFNGDMDIRHITGNFSNLINACSMFMWCGELLSCDALFPALKINSMVFTESGMFSMTKSLKSMQSNFPALTDGMRMFRFDPALETVSSSFPSLVNGDGMFDVCTILDASSITNIIASLPTYTLGGHNIGFGGVLALTQAHIDSATAKGWTVQS